MTGEFWFAIGIIVGIILQFLGRWFYDWYRRPIITFIKGSELNIWSVESGMDVYPPGTDIRTRTPDMLPGKVYRVKIDNIGKSAAYNVRGTVELRRPDTSHEQRICWYEGNVASITINSKDHSYLDIYGVPGVEAPEAYNRTIAIPMEHGWSSGVLAYRLMGDEEWRLRVTAANCKPLALELVIDPDNNCDLVDVCIIRFKRFANIRAVLANLRNRFRKLPTTPVDSNGRGNQISRRYIQSQAPAFVLAGFLLIQQEGNSYVILAILSLLWAVFLCAIIFFESQWAVNTIRKLLDSPYEIVYIILSLLVFATAFITNLVDLIKNGKGETYFYVFYAFGLIYVLSIGAYQINGWRKARVRRKLSQKIPSHIGNSANTC